MDDAEACVYAYGALKFLTMNVKLLGKVLDLGILPLMVLHIKLINTAVRALRDSPRKAFNELEFSRKLTKSLFTNKLIMCFSN